MAPERMALKWSLTGALFGERLIVIEKLFFLEPPILHLPSCAIMFSARVAKPPRWKNAADVRLNQSPPLPVLGEMGGVGAQGGGWGEVEWAVGVGDQAQGVGAGFGEAGLGDEDCSVGVDGPQALVEAPVGVLAESEAVGEFVVAASGPGVDVGGVDDAGAFGGHAAQAGEGTGEAVPGDHLHGEPGAAAFPLGGLFGLPDHVGAARMGGVAVIAQAHAFEQGDLFGWREISVDQQQARLEAESGVHGGAEEVLVQGAGDTAFR